MKIVVLDGYTENPGDLSWEGLEALGTLTVYDRTPGDKVIERIADAQAVYTNKTPITGETIEKCANMKFIGVLATGYNVIDIKAARSANVVVSKDVYKRQHMVHPKETYIPNPAMVKEYETRFEEYKRIYPGLKDISHRISSRTSIY